MRKNILDICFIFVLVIIIAFVILYIYRQNSNENQYTLDEMTENMPEQINEIEVEEQEPDELIVKQVDIKGKEYNVIAILSIPTLDIEYPVLETTSKELLKVSLNKYWGPNPNKVGNFCILGHNYNDSRFLGNLYKINIGDTINLQDMAEKTVKYKVYETYIADPEDTSCTSQLTDGQKEITLITCTRDFKQRFIVKARAIES